MPGGSQGERAWAAGRFVAGAIFRSAKDAVTAMDAALKTGIGFMDAFKALRTVALTRAPSRTSSARPPEALRGLGDGTATFKVAAFSVASADAGDLKDCGEELFRDLAEDGDHIVLGVNPYSDDLTEIVGGRTFGADEFATEPPESPGMGVRPPLAGGSGESGG